MDKNKLKVLQDIGYKIAPVCSLCHHGDFPQNDFGTCKINTYQHLKHTGDVRYLSIHKLGSCAMFTVKSSAIAPLGAFEQFLEFNF